MTAYRLRFRCGGHHALTDTDDNDRDTDVIFCVSRPEEEAAKIQLLKDLNRSLSVADITVDTPNRLVLVTKRGPVSSQEVGERWVAYVREKISDALASPVPTPVMQAGQRSGKMQEQRLMRGPQQFSGSGQQFSGSGQQFSGSGLSCLQSQGEPLSWSQSQESAVTSGDDDDQPQQAVDTGKDWSLLFSDSQASLMQNADYGLETIKYGTADWEVDADSDQAYFYGEPLAEEDRPTEAQECDADWFQEQTLDSDTGVAQQGQPTEDQDQSFSCSTDYWFKVQKSSKLDPALAMYLQGVRGQDRVDFLQNQYHCQISVRSPGQRVLGKAEMAGGHEITVREGNMAVTDCHVMLLPMSAGQDWSPLQKHILNRSFLSSDVDVYADEVGLHAALPKTLTLPCNTSPARATITTRSSSRILQNIMIMATPPGSSATFRQDVREACDEVFAKLMTTGQTSVAIPLPLSLDASVVDCLEALLPAVQEALKPRGDACKVMLVLEEEVSADEWRQFVDALDRVLGRSCVLLTDYFTAESREERPVLSSTQPHVQVVGSEQNATACLTQIKRLQVPEDFRRYAERLEKLLMTANSASSAKANSGSPVAQLCAWTPSTQPRVETEQKQCSYFQEFSKSLSSLSIDSGVHAGEASFPEQRDDEDTMQSVSPGLRASTVSEVYTRKAYVPELRDDADTRQSVFPVSRAFTDSIIHARKTSLPERKRSGDLVRQSVFPIPPFAAPEPSTTSDDDVSRGPRTELVTPSGIKVSVYKADITALRVDCVVNPTTPQMTSLQGVAGVIVKAAGPALLKETQDHYKKHGQLQRTKVVTTGAGQLPCRAVLHTFGPRWNDYPDKSQCRKLLSQTVFNCLEKAADMGLASLALPAVSAGISGVPKEVCAEQYLAALQRFEEERGGRSSVSHVHFVDISDPLVTTVQQTFSAKWNLVMSAPRSLSPVPAAMTACPAPSSISTLTSTSRAHQGRRDLVAQAGTQVSVSHQGRRDLVTQAGTQVSVYTADITRLLVDAIVSATNSQLYQGTGAALAIANAAGPAMKTTVNAYASRLQGTLKVGTVVEVPGGQLACRTVLMAVGPRWADYSNKVRCQQDLTTTVLRCLQTANQGQATSLALPLISSGMFGVPAQTCAESYLSGIQQFEGQYCGAGQQPPYLRHVHFVDIKADKITFLQGVFSQHLGASSTAQVTSSSTPMAVTTGLQPSDGTMSVRRSSSRDLPGHQGKGRFTITYTFPAGTQNVGHPHPGKRYLATERTAYLPNTTRGRKVLMLLLTAFDRQQVFTIATSQTTGVEGVVWNIGHKTQREGGPARYGYPDPSYLQTVEGELAKQGVTETELTSQQKDFIHNPDSYRMSALRDPASGFRQ